MKKKIKKTGEIVDVIGFRADKGEERDWNDYVHYKTLDKLVTGINGLNLYQDFEDVEEELTKEINWEEHRIIIAAQAMQAFIREMTLWDDPDRNMTDVAKCSMKYADALIAELKKGGEK